MEYLREKFTELTEEVKKLTKPLHEDTEKITNILKKYEEIINEEGATFKEYDELSELSQTLTKVKTDLRNVREKETSKDIVIQFVGKTSSGKSSLINALLRESRLPVGFMRTTMCSTTVCCTEESEWSIEIIGEDGSKEILSVGTDDKIVCDLLNKMTGQENKQQRKEKGIDRRTILQVNWPLDQCKTLPRNVVLCDTPGLGENNEDDELTTQRGEKADIIVAVMDSMSPSLGTLINLVKRVGCQFTFAVFTKWDECLKKAQEKGEHAVKNAKQLANDYEQEFCEAVQEKGDVYFVNVKDPDDKFRQFEDKLAKSVAKLKVESLTQQAKSVALDSRKVCTKLKDMVDATQREKLKSLGKKLDFVHKDKETTRKAFDDTESSDKDLEILNNKAVQRFLKEFENDLLQGKSEEKEGKSEEKEGKSEEKKGKSEEKEGKSEEKEGKAEEKEGKSEEKAVKDFLDKINEEIKRSMAHKRDAIALAFQELKKNIQSYKIQSPNMPSSQELLQLTDQRLPEDQYKWYRDLNYYLTNNYICATLAGFVIVGTPFLLAGAGLGAVFAGETIIQGMIAGGAVGGPVGGTFGAVGGGFGELTRGFHLGDQLKRKFPISQYKVNCWISFLEDQLKKHHQECKRLLREEKDAALTDIKRKLENSEHEISAEIVALCDQSHILKKQLAQLEIVCNRMQTTIEGFDKLLADLLKAEEEMASESAPQNYNSQADLHSTSTPFP